MEANFYYVLHVISVVLLAGFTFGAIAAPDPGKRKRTLMMTGILSLVALIAGFGLLSKQGHGFPGWVLVKLVCWLGLSGLAGIAFRGRPKGALTLVAVALIAVAVWAVYYRPF